MTYAWGKPITGKESNIYKHCREPYCHLIRTGEEIDECRGCQVRVLIEQSKTQGIQKDEPVTVFMCNSCNSSPCIFTRPPLPGEQVYNCWKGREIEIKSPRR